MCADPPAMAGTDRVPGAMESLSDGILSMLCMYTLLSAGRMFALLPLGLGFLLKVLVAGIVQFVSYGTCCKVAQFVDYDGHGELSQGQVASTVVEARQTSTSRSGSSTTRNSTTGSFPLARGHLPCGAMDRAGVGRGSGTTARRSDATALSSVWYQAHLSWVAPIRSSGRLPIPVFANGHTKSSRTGRGGEEEGKGRGREKGVLASAFKTDVFLTPMY